MPDPDVVVHEHRHHIEQFLAAPPLPLAWIQVRTSPLTSRYRGSSCRRVGPKGPVAQIVIGKMLDHAGVALHLQPRQAERRYGPDLAAPS